jgi:hypothetical protein
MNDKSMMCSLDRKEEMGRIDGENDKTIEYSVRIA